MVAAGINLLERSPQAAVRRVMVLLHLAIRLLYCCFLSGLYTLIKTIGLAVWRILLLCFPFGLLTAAVCLCVSVESC